MTTTKQVISEETVADYGLDLMNAFPGSDCDHGYSNAWVVWAEQYGSDLERIEASLTRVRAAASAKFREIKTKDSTSAARAEELNERAAVAVHSIGRTAERIVRMVLTPPTDRRSAEAAQE